MFLTELGAARHDSARLATGVERILANPQAEQSPEYRRQRELNRIETKNLLIQIDSLLEPQQREYLQEQLWELARDFSELSGAQYHRLSCAVQDAPVPRRPGTAESGRAVALEVPFCRDIRASLHIAGMRRSGPQRPKRKPYSLRSFVLSFESAESARRAGLKMDTGSRVPALIPSRRRITLVSGSVPLLGPPRAWIRQPFTRRTKNRS